MTAVVAGVGAGTATAAPTCAGLLGIAVHGQHVVGDYVTGTGHDELGWPASGQVGATTGGARGAAVPGGPGPAFHGVHGVAPGASFCLEQARSSGAQLGR